MEWIKHLGKFLANKMKNWGQDLEIWNFQPICFKYVLHFHSALTFTLHNKYHC